jgi:hypothetical protein
MTSKGATANDSKAVSKHMQKILETDSTYDLKGLQDGSGSNEMFDFIRGRK